MSKSKKEEGNIYYVYIYVDPRNNSPFYVGKGHNKRYLDHLNTAKNKKSNNYKVNKIRKIQRETGQDPEIILFKTGLSEDEAFSIEIELIKRWGRRDIKTGCLLNMTDGGEGENNVVYTEEIRQKMSNSKKGRCSGKNNSFYGKHHTDATKEVIGRINGGKNNSHYIDDRFRRGKEWAKTIKERDNYTCQNCFVTAKDIGTKNIFAAHILSKTIFPELKFDLDNGITLCRSCHTIKENYNRPEETKRKQSESLKGKPKSELHKQHLSEAKKGKKRSVESVQKQVNTQKGRLAWNKGLKGVYIPTEETKQKQSTALKGKYKGRTRSEESIRKQIETCRIKRELKQKGAL